MKNIGKNLAVFIILGFLIFSAVSMFEENAMGVKQQDIVKYSDFLNRMSQQEVIQVTIADHKIKGRLVNGQSFITYIPNDPDLIGKLQAAGISFEVAPKEEPGLLATLFYTFGPILLLIGFWLLFMKQMNSGGGGRAMGFGRSPARLLNQKEGRITFLDVAGIDEAKAELEEVVEFLKNPQKFQRLGGRIPKGVLLLGPPGTGKTLLARAVAGEANVPFFTISGSEFVEMFVGVGASRVRDLFEQGKRHAPCLIFIDEIDTVGRHRGAGLGGGNDEREQTLNQMLVEMDGFTANEGVILIAATNRPDVLDPALLRPGRFDRQVVVPNPDVSGREKILRVHLRKAPLAKDVDPSVIARGTPGFSGADLANLVNEASLLAAGSNKTEVSMFELEAAKDKVMMGAERRSLAMSEEEKKLTAYHEGGHAIVGINLPASDPIHKATIIPRGRALGLVMRLPEGDRYSVTREKLEADLAVAMGGRVAEEMIFGHHKVTSGASSDIAMATSMARKMVTEWGFSDKLGPLAYNANDEEVFLGHSVTRHQNTSDETAREIDKEIRRFVEAGYEQAKKILTDKKKDLETLAQALLKYETLSGEEIKDLLKGKNVIRDHEGQPPIKALKKEKARISSVPVGEA